MPRPQGLKLALGLIFAIPIALLSLGLFSCGGAPTPFLVSGPGQFGNVPPTLSILEPNTNITRGRGDPFLIRWTDSDPDDNALISFALINTQTSGIIRLVEGIEENDLTGPDFFVVATTLIPVGNYHLQGVIDDGTNPPVVVFATSGGASPQRIVITIVGEGEGPQTQPPVVAVVQPEFNLSVSQDDVLTVVVQPTILPPAPEIPFDPDSDITLYVLLDLDNDPTNDDPSNPDPNRIIVLRQTTLAQGTFEAQTFNISIDLATVPPRPNGEPYFIRATADDGTNPRVHRYAVGTINVVQLAAGLVDLADIGRTKSGATFYGFNPGANVGSRIASISDFDGDGVADFAIVAQFGNPRNLGPIGEAYAIYGRDRVRFGGMLPVNTVSQTISGFIMEAPPIRNLFGADNPRTDGITDIGFIPDLSGDGLPELLIGLPHVTGAFEAMDFDPDDADLSAVTGTVDVEVVIRRGLVTTQIDDEDPTTTSITYNAVADTTIKSLQPTTGFGPSLELSWINDGEGEIEFSLIKFGNVLNLLPDGPANINITSVDATLEFRVFNTGSTGNLHRSFRNFTEQTTWNTYATGGGEAVAGVDYETDNIGTVNAGTVDTVTVDISDVVRLLIDGELTAFNNELRFIIIPFGTDSDDRTAVRSSEFSTIENDRPILRIAYSRLGGTGALGCYPDNLVNNLTDAENLDWQFTAGGMALILNSENRDNQPRVSPTPARLDTTVVTLELIGQQIRPILSGAGIDQLGNIFARADDYNVLDRIAGARFMAGPFDYVDHRLLNQPPRADLFGQRVSWIRDLNNDGFPEIIISAPRNEAHLRDLRLTYGFQSTHLASTRFTGSIVVVPGADYNDAFFTEVDDQAQGSSSIPNLDQHRFPPFGQCRPPLAPRSLFIPADTFMVFAEDPDDFLGDAQSAGDFNQDGIDDILCGAPFNNRGNVQNTGATYILYGRTVLGNFDLKNADHPILRTPMLRVRGARTGDHIGWRQTTGLDVNGDRIDDVFISSPHTDFGGVTRLTCAADFNGDGIIDADDLRLTTFNTCRNNFGDQVFSTDPCKVFDYDNDGKITDIDRCVFCCLSAECVPDETCIYGTTPGNCCNNLVNNGFAAVIFGGVFTDGDRTINQIATPDLPGVIFYGSAPGHRAGFDISSAGDFNQDGFGDILIAAPGEIRCDQPVPPGRTCADVGRERLGVVYLVFGGTHLTNQVFSLADVGTPRLPGIVFLSPFVRGRPNEAAPTTVAFIGDINNDGFGDIAIGNPNADFIDLSFPQGPNAPGSDAAVGRRRNAGHAYIIYGNNFGSNRLGP